jgi:AcrR family transcriptional regulator
MEIQPPSRRERLRAQTVREIKEIARKHMAAEGPAALSLRAIAREMGMTPGAVYGYFDTRDALITALVTETYHKLADQEEAARDAVPADDPAGRLVAVAMAYRRWAVSSPDEFQLLYGDPIPGYQAPTDGPLPVAAHRACTMLSDLVAAAWPRARASHATGEHRWDEFDPALADQVRRAHPELPPDAVGLAVRVWGRMHGLVALEVYGHLASLTNDPAKLYRAEMADLARSLGSSG